MWSHLAFKIYTIFSVVIVTFTLLFSLALTIAEIVAYRRENRKNDKLPNNGVDSAKTDDF